MRRLIVFTERLSALPARLGDFQPAPPASDRSSWESLPDCVRAALIAEGAAAAANPFPDLPATLYLDYTRSGDRRRFETPYFARRRMLNALALAECAEGRGRFLDRVIDGVLLLSEESGWQLPAHNSQQRGGKRDALPDPERPVVDLFAAETGAQLAVLAALLGPQMEAAARGILARIDRELERRIFGPYLGRGFWWMGREGDGPTNNWTTWCTQNLLLAAFCRPLDQSRRREIVGHAVASLDAFLAGYGEDGACAEGALYYRHAALCLSTSLLVLDAIAPEAFHPLWREPKLRNLAEYIVNVHIGDRQYFNFGDCSAVLDACGAREFLFGRWVGSKSLANFAAADWQRDKRLTLPDEISTFTRVQLAFTAAELTDFTPAPVELRNRFLSSVGLFLARNDRFSLAVRAGHNGDSHGHNDVGSFIVYKDGQPVLIDIGVETYSARTFSAERYDIWTVQSAWHNLPTFEGIMQRHGELFAARFVDAIFASDHAEITMDIAGAYPPEARLSRYTRRVRLSRGGAVDLWDSYEGGKTAVLSLMFAQEPMLDADGITLQGLASIAIEGAKAPIGIEPVSITDSRLRIAWPEQVFRVLVPLQNELHLSIT